MYQNDMFATRRCVHVKLRTQFIQQFRAELLRRRLSMQEVFDEFAALIASGDTSSLKIVDKIVYNKNKEKMDRILKSDSKATKTQARLIKTSKKDPVPDHVKEDFFDMITRRNPLNQDDEK